MIIAALLAELDKWNRKLTKKCRFGWKKQKIIKQKFIMIYENGWIYFNFRDIEIEKDKSHHYKSPIEDVDTENVLVSSKISAGENSLLATCMMIIKLSHCI